MYHRSNAVDTATRSRRPWFRRSSRCLIIVALAASILPLLSGCAEHPQFYRGGIKNIEPNKMLAVLPLVNYTQYDQASDVVMNAVVVELLDAGVFRVVDPGIVDTIVLEKRLRLTDRLPLVTIQDLGKQLGVDYLLVGSINDYSIIQGKNSRLPAVSISLRIVTCDSGQIIWASTHSRRGDDAESFFGIGRIESLEQLASVTVAEMIQTLKP